MTAPRGGRITRRRLLAAGVRLTVGARTVVARGAPRVFYYDFSALPDAPGWPAGWACPGVANLRVTERSAFFTACWRPGPTWYPYDPRPVAFAVDFARPRRHRSWRRSPRRVRLRRRRHPPHFGPRDYYAAFYDTQQATLSIVRRNGADDGDARLLPAAPIAPATSARAHRSGRTPDIAERGPDHRRARPRCRHRRRRRATRRSSRRATRACSARRARCFPSFGTPRPSCRWATSIFLPYGVQEGEEVERLAGRPADHRTRSGPSPPLAFRQITITSRRDPEADARVGRRGDERGAALRRRAA